MIDSLIYITGLLVWIGCVFWFLFYVLVQWWHSLKHHLWIYQLWEYFNLKKIVRDRQLMGCEEIEWNNVYNVIFALLSEDETYKRFNKNIMRKKVLRVFLDLYFVTSC